MPVSESCLEGTRPSPRTTVANEWLFSNVSRLYCRLFHRSISRPVNGKYRCWKCLQQFEIRW
jgi:hypothetical protein